MTPSDSQPTLRTSQHTFCVEGDLTGLQMKLEHEAVDEGIDCVTLAIRASTPCVPPPISLVWRHPTIDIQSRWHPAAARDRCIHPDWNSTIHSRMVVSSPVVSLFNIEGTNRLTFACDDTISPLAIRAGVHEETAEFTCAVDLFHPDHRWLPLTEYRLCVRLDTRDVPFSRALDAVRHWWETMDRHRPLAVPDSARRLFYSTWYSFHQTLTDVDIVEECRRASDLGCRAIIVDDGWQTLDAGRGYAYTGDWEPVRLPAMRALVDRVHDTGMKFLLWYAVPFVGIHSKAFEKFKDKQITLIERAKAGVLDPRYPDVRAYLIDTFTAALREWDLDGFKFDFVDFFDQLKGGPATDGMDIPTIPDAAQRLLGDILDALAKIKPDVMIEFRQPYVGPAMRRFANMFRSYDCPNDAITNRCNTLDLRLLCGRTVVHGDMFMWNADEPAEVAALQLLNVLFSVPQVSVRLDRVPPEHIEMLRFWLAFWNDHRDVLLDGDLTLLQPEAFYPAVIARTDDKCVIAAYQDVVLPLPEALPAETFLINATRNQRLIVEASGDLGQRHARVHDCRGREIHEVTLTLSPGIHELPVPPSGRMTIR